MIKHLANVKLVQTGIDSDKYFGCILLRALNAKWAICVHGTCRRMCIYRGIIDGFE